jgi:hypothetical protein
MRWLKDNGENDDGRCEGERGEGTDQGLKSETRFRVYWASAGAFQGARVVAPIDFAERG